MRNKLHPSIDAIVSEGLAHYLGSDECEAYGIDVGPGYVTLYIGPADGSDPSPELPRYAVTVTREHWAESTVCETNSAEDACAAYRSELVGMGAAGLL